MILPPLRKNLGQPLAWNRLVVRCIHVPQRSPASWGALVEQSLPLRGATPLREAASNVNPQVIGGSSSTNAGRSLLAQDWPKLFGALLASGEAGGCATLGQPRELGSFGTSQLCWV